MMMILIGIVNILSHYFARSIISSPLYRHGSGVIPALQYTHRCPLNLQKHQYNVNEERDNGKRGGRPASQLSGSTTGGPWRHATAAPTTPTPQRTIICRIPFIIVEKWHNIEIPDSFFWNQARVGKVCQTDCGARRYTTRVLSWRCRLG